MNFDDGSALDADDLQRIADARRRALRSGWMFWGGLGLGLFFVGLGIFTVVGAVQRPGVYAHLRHDGVRLSARFDGCEPVSRFDNRHRVCRLSVTYHGRSRRWEYHDDYPQFDHVAVGDPVSVLLDPAHPTTAYTVHDVTTNDNAGVLSVIGLFGIGVIVVGRGGQELELELEAIATAG